MQTTNEVWAHNPSVVRAPGQCRKPGPPSLPSICRKTLHTDGLLLLPRVEDGATHQRAASRCGGLLRLSLSADGRSSDDAIAFEGQALWVMTWVQNDTFSPASMEGTCDAAGNVLRNASIPGGKPLLNNNMMSTSKSLNGPWSPPVALDGIFDAAVPPFIMKGVPNRNSNLAITIQAGRYQQEPPPYREPARRHWCGLLRPP